MSSFLGIGFSSKEIRFEKSVESPDGTGQLCCLSDPIECIDFDEFWKATECWRDRTELVKEFGEVAYKTSKCEDGGVIGESTFSSNGTLAEEATGAQVGKKFYKYFCNTEEKEFKSYNYGADSTLSPSSMTQISTLKFWQDPFRLEFYIQEMPERASGPGMKFIADTVLGFLKLKVGTEMNVDSPSTPGAKSILSSPIEDPNFDFSHFWELYKKVAIDTYGFAEAEEHLLVGEINVIVATFYMSIFCEPDSKMITQRQHGTDETLTDDTTAYCWKLVDNPTRIEVWMDKKEHRASGMKAQIIAENFINAILRLHRGESMVARNPAIEAKLKEASEAEIARKTAALAGIS